MKIIADQQIPYVTSFFGAENEIITLSEEEITTKTVKDADVLLVRSVTPINEILLANTSIRFIGSATAGTDHLDSQWLDKAGIAWAYAPGCNARAVADYVLLCFIHLVQSNRFKKAPQRAGIIGIGNVGQQVADRLKRLGLDVLLNDPPRQERDIDFVSTPLDAFYDLDVICLHTPLTTTGNYPTVHLLDDAFLSQLSPHCVVLNAGRGGCIDTNALKHYKLTTVLDVWQNEPNIDVDLATSAFIATPHIAGYDQPAKYRATKQLFAAFCNHFEMDHYIALEEDPSEYTELNLSASHWMDQAIQLDNLKARSESFQAALKENPNNSAEIFKTFRKKYPLRKEFYLT